MAAWNSEDKILKIKNLKAEKLHAHDVQLTGLTESHWYDPLTPVFKSIYNFLYSFSIYLVPTWDLWALH